MPRRPHSSLPLPRAWPRHVRSAAVHAIALARLALTTARGQANPSDPGSGRISRLTEEILLLKEEMLIKDARMKGISAQRRPHYLPTERLAILELQAARGWSQTSFLPSGVRGHLREKLDYHTFFLSKSGHHLGKGVYWSTDSSVRPNIL